MASLLGARLRRRLALEAYRIRQAVLGLPEQTSMEIAVMNWILDQLSDQHSRPIQVFEWGAGRSTLFYPRRLRQRGLAFEWHAIDNSRQWHERILRGVHRAGLHDAVHVYQSEFTPFWADSDWDPHTHAWRSAPPCNSAIAHYVSWPRTLGCRFDLLFIDGRYRKQCLRVARETLAEDGCAVLHDAQRAHYLEAIGAFPYWAWVNSSALPGTTDAVRLWVGALQETPIIVGLRAKHDNPQPTGSSI